MKYCIHQRAFSWDGPFEISDEHGNALLTGAGELLSDGRRLRLTDRTGAEVIVIVQKARSLHSRFELIERGETVGGVVKKWLRPAYALSGLPWAVAGDCGQHDYEIREGGRVVAEIRPERQLWGPCCAVRVEDEREAPRAVAVAIVVECLAR